jgi:hypothetical protein
LQANIHNNISTHTTTQNPLRYIIAGHDITAIFLMRRGITW